MDQRLRAVTPFERNPDMASTSNSFPLTGPINLHARLGHGQVTVTAVDDLETATVTLRPRGRVGLNKAAPTTNEVIERMVVEMRGPTLFVTAPRQGGIFDMFGGWRREKDAVDVDIQVPSGTAVKISTFTADVHVLGRCGGADVATGSATINLADVDGNLLLRYGSGRSSVDHVSGSVTIRSGSGDAKLGTVEGGVEAGCGSGRLEVTSVRGTVRSRAGSGDAMLGVVYGDVDLASGSGTMQIGLPAGVAAKLDVTTGSGTVNTDLPIDNGPRRESPVITVKARTGSGNIRLFRAA
jgi:hypothetical protein